MKSANQYQHLINQQFQHKYQLRNESINNLNSYSINQL